MLAKDLLKLKDTDVIRLVGNNACDSLKVIFLNLNKEKLTIKEIKKYLSAYSNLEKYAGSHANCPIEFELVTNTPKFKVGDKVRVTNPVSSFYNKEFVITEIKLNGKDSSYSQCSYKNCCEGYACYDQGGSSWSSWFHDLELVTRMQSFKIGDKVRVIKSCTNKNEDLTLPIERCSGVQKYEIKIGSVITLDKELLVHCAMSENEPKCFVAELVTEEEIKPLPNLNRDLAVATLKALHPNENIQVQDFLKTYNKIYKVLKNERY